MLTTLSFSQGAPQEMKDKADKLFENEQYVEATTLYSRILALEPRDFDFNFKYGACLLYNSTTKKDAINRLKYAIESPTIDARAYFFYGRALHLDYQFEAGRKMYKSYTSKREKSDDRYDADRAIQMCENGKRLLTTFTDIIVAEKQEIGESQFYKIYTNSRTVGGDILVSAQFQSKLDKKMGHTPVVHFGPNAKAIYYSSYGDDMDSGKDIYVRRLLPNGKWGDPQLLPGGVNTNEDEDFPYLHPSGNFLYFSSKGHNSMGGYDVFMSRLNHDNGSFKAPENVDFAISSPDDDLFYVVDSLFQNAYFASSRQSQEGMLHVYRVKVARVPIQEVIIMGDFVSEVDPELKDVNVTLITHSNGNDLGKIKTNPKGKYSYVFPQGGKYDYEISLGGTDEVYRFTVELPFLDEFKPLKQRILHTTNEEGQEVILIQNLFDENVEGADAIIAQVIRKKAELNVNVDNFDLEELEAKKKQDEILADLGYRGMSMPEVANQLEVLARNAEKTGETVARVGSNLEEEIIAKSDRIISLNAIEKELTDKANDTDDPAMKYRLLNEAEQKQREKLALIDQIKDLNELQENISSELGGPAAGGSSSKVAEIEREFKERIDNGDDEGALTLLVENKSELEKAKGASPSGLLEEYIAESIQLRDQISEERKKVEELKRTKTQIEAKIKNLEMRKGAAKKKELEQIEQEIAENTESAELTEDLIKSTQKKIQNLEKDLNKTEEQMASFQNAMATEETPVIDPEKSKEIESEVAEIAGETPTDFEAEIAQLEKDHPELTGEVPVVTEATKIMDGYKAEGDHIDNDPTLSELEKTYRHIENNEETINDFDDRIEEIETILESGADPDLEKEKDEILEYKAELETENRALEEKAAVLKSTTPDVALSPEDVIGEIAPTYADDIASIEGNPDLTDRERLEAVLDAKNNLKGSVTGELKTVERALEENPEDPEAESRKAILEEILATVTTEIDKTEAEIEALPVDVVAEGPTKSEVLASVAPTYSEKVKEIEDNPDTTPIEKEKAIVEEEKALLGEIADEKKDLEKKIKKDAEDTAAKERLATIEEIESETEKRIEDREKTIEALTADVVVEGPTKAEVLESLSPTYSEKVKEIEDNPDTSPLEKEKAIVEEEKALLDEIEDEKKDLEKKINKDTDDIAAKERLATIEEIEAETEKRIEDREKTIETLTADIVVEGPSKAEVLKSLSPTYLEKVKDIEDNPDTSPLEKEKAIVEEEKALLAEIEDEKKDLEKKIKKDAEDTVTKERLATIEEIEAESEKSIEEREAKIAELEGTPITGPSVSEAKEAIIADLDPKYADEKDAIAASDVTSYEKSLRRATVEAGFLDRLIEEKGNLEKELSKNPEATETKERLAVVEQMIAEQESILEEIAAEGVEVLTAGDRERIISDLDPSYAKEISEALTPEESIAREVELQEKIREEIADLEKKKARKPSVSIDLTLSTYEKLIEESEKRVKAAEGETPVVTPSTEAKETFVASVRSEMLEENIDAITESPTTKEGLEEQDQILEEYEKALDKKIEEVTDEYESSPSDALEEELNWLEEEKETVVKKRRRIRMSIGELETEVIAATGSETDRELKELEVKERELEARLTEETPSGERKKIEKELDKIDERKKEREVELLSEELVETEKKGEELVVVMDEKLSPDSPVASGVKEHYEAEDKAIDALVVEAEKADSEAEKKYLLEAAKIKREELNRDVAEVIAEETMKGIEEEKGISLSSTEDLKRKKRRFTISIGELTREIAEVDEDISTAKRKELPVLEKKKESLVAEKELLEARLEDVDTKLEGRDIPVPVVTAEAVETAITFKEERTLAGTEEYKEYKELAEEALKVENEIRTLEEDLTDERAAIQRMIVEGADPIEIEKKAEEIKGIESDIERLGIDLTQKKYLADKALPENEEEAMKMQNLVARGVAPIKTVVAAAAILAMPSEGLSIDTESETVNHGAREIPVGVESPSGLVYRVQVGAFSRPLPPTVFKEFNPVSGEKIEGTGITRYMAGFFNSSEDVVKARGDIRGLGYSDAFVVAYCDGKRITFGQARRLEASGECVPKGTSEIMIEVAEKTAESLGVPMSREVPDVPELSYMDAPGATDAEPIENMKGLFFTVQVGVFNRPVGSEAVKEMPDIITIRLPNGQIRYSSGKFDSVEDAYPRQKEARTAGVGGAFITAYYNGERISIGNARKLLIDNGKSILQSEMEKVKPVESIETPDGIVRTDSVDMDLIEMPVALEEWEHRVQIVTKKTFDKFPRDVLNRYNAEGSFYYDEKDKKVKSVVYKNADYLPRVWNFRKDIDTVYLPVGDLADTKTEIVEIVFTDSIIPGDFMDWMLRCNYRREIEKSLKGTEIRIFGVEEDDLETMLENIRQFGIEPEVILKTEEELELEER